VGRLRAGDRIVMEMAYGRFTYVVTGAGVIRAGVPLDLRTLRAGDLVLGAGDPPVRRVQRVLIKARLAAAGS
jgi:hypothetical protein